MEVFCLINGKGKVIKKENGILIVEFEDEKGNTFTSRYTEDGKLIFENGATSHSRVLYEQKPYIVLENAILDESGKVIGDKDFIVFGEKGSLVFKAGFFDAKNLALFTKDGYRNPKNPIFKKLSPELVIYKLSSPEIDSLKELLKEEETTKNTEPVEEIPEMIEESFLEFNQPVETENLVKEAKENKEEPKKTDNFVLSIEEGEFLPPRFSWLKAIAPDLMEVEVVDKKTSVSFFKEFDGAIASATISFKPEIVAKLIKANNKAALRDAINVFDAFVEINEKGKKVQKNLDELDILLDIKNGMLSLNFR